MTATLPINLSDALTPAEITDLAAEAVRRQTSLETLAIEAVRAWLANREVKKAQQHAANPQEAA